MSKGALAEALAEKGELNKAVASKIINSLAEFGTAEVRHSGVFCFPGLCRIKTRMKRATKAGKWEMFGNICFSKAKPAKKRSSRRSRLSLALCEGFQMP